MWYEAVPGNETAAKTSVEPTDIRSPHPSHSGHGFSSSGVASYALLGPNEAKCPRALRGRPKSPVGYSWLARPFMTYRRSASISDLGEADYTALRPMTFA